MANGSSCIANATAFVMSVALVLSLSAPTINAQPDLLASMNWAPPDIASFITFERGIPLPQWYFIEFRAEPTHPVVRVSEADYNAGKVDNPISRVPIDEYGLTILMLEDIGWYYLVSDTPGDLELGYKMKFEVGNSDCMRLNQGQRLT